MSTYSALGNYLLSLDVGVNNTVLGFSKIEEIISRKLPISAYKHRAWWGNETKGSHIHARNWLNSGWKVGKLSIKDKIVEFVRTSKQSDANNSKGMTFPINNNAVISPREFEEIARASLSNEFKTKLNKRLHSFVPKIFDFISQNEEIVGDAKYYTMVGGVSNPPAKFSTIAEHVWLLEKTNSKIKILAFGNDIRVPVEWLRLYGLLVRGIKFFFIENDGKLKELN